MQLQAQMPQARLSLRRQHRSPHLPTKPEQADFKDLVSVTRLTLIFGHLSLPEVPLLDRLSLLATATLVITVDLIVV